MIKILRKFCSKGFSHNPQIKQQITTENADWDYVGFKLYQLSKGESCQIYSESNETCVVFISGYGDISVAGQEYHNIGNRNSPFEKIAPYSLYSPKQQEITITATSDLELGVCSSPDNDQYPARLITPQQVGVELRGVGFNQRLVHNILPETSPASSLLVVEVFTDSGNTSSYPSHKHDQKDDPNETYLEETYYHRFDPPQGFAMQRIYTDDRQIDQALVVENGDVVLVHQGYHPVATVAGYDNYYLNVMAGPVRQWKFSFDPDHQWITGPEYAKKFK